MRAGGISSMVERVVDDKQTFSLADFFEKFWARKWLFAICVLIPTVVALVVAALTPVTWTARTQILIRYSSSQSAFLKGLIPDDQVALSGPTSGELIRSLPTIEATVVRLKIEKGDLYRSTRDVLSDYVAGAVGPLFSSSGPPTEAARIASVAKVFQDSLSASTKSSGSDTTPVAILDKGSPVPTAQKGDELITLNVRAFNRERIAEIANGLAETFVDQYQKISAEDAQRSSKFLTLLANRYSDQIRRAERDPNAALSLPDTNIGGQEGVTPQIGPLTAKLADELGDREAELARDRQIFRDDAPQIRNAEAAIGNIRQLYNRQQRLDAAHALLERVETRRLQAQNTESLYRNQLVPISIVERAITPPPSKSKKIVRLLVSGIAGAMIGAVLGFALVIVLGLLDERLYSERDVAQALGLPLIGTLPALAYAPAFDSRFDSNAPELLPAAGGIAQILAHLSDRTGQGSALVAALVSSENDDGKSFIALQLAHVMAKSGGRRVLLIDGDPGRASVSRALGLADALGLASAGGDKAPSSLVKSTGVANLDILPAGSVGSGASFHLPLLNNFVNEARQRYDMIMIDTPSDNMVGGAVVACMPADFAILVLRQGESRKEVARGLIRKLHDLSVPIKGAVLNLDTRAKGKRLRPRWPFSS